MKHLSTRDKMIQEKTAISYQMVFNDEKIPYHKVSHKQSQDDKCQTGI